MTRSTKDPFAKIKSRKTKARSVSLPISKTEIVQPSMPQYRQTEIKMFQKCGKQWEFRYVLGLTIPPTASQTLGSAVDAGVSQNFAQKIESKTDLPLQEVLDVYSQSFETRAKETDWKWSGENKHAQKDLGVKLVEIYQKTIAPQIQPVTVQETFWLPTDAGYAVTGTMDVVDDNDIVRDIKTSKNRYSPNSISKSIQPALYDYAFENTRNRKSKGFVFDVLVKASPQSQVVAGEVSLSDREWLFDTISNMHRAIQAGVALPAPEGAWWCSPKWCGYWTKCKGKR